MDAIKGYELREQIGTGGFGAVYRAFQTTVGREVAVKIILPNLASQPDFIRRFEGEAQLVARLEHPHIVPLHDYWRDPDGAYLVMRWLRGGSLREALLNGPFELRAAALLLDQLAGALSLAHRNNVIHRDIKPGNILLDEDGNAYLTDFGIAKDLNLSGSGTQPDAIIGSLDYISPEQARSEPVTSRTDLYSLGVTMYEVITSHHPFPNLSTVERLYKHINDPLPEITTLEPSASVEVNRVIHKATAKNPDHRYPDALAFAADFREAIGLNRTPTTMVELLTQREHEILHLIIEGMSNKEIAQHLTVTLGTVKWYVNQIYGKLGVRSRVQAIVRARELNLIGSERAAVSDGSFTTSNLPAPENPYKGLRAFQSADEQDFFGREELTQKLLSRMKGVGAWRAMPLPAGQNSSDNGRFLAVVGPSGSGKSSVVKAGLIPALWRGDLPGSERWFVAEMLPGAHALDRLEVALIRVAANQSRNLNEQLLRDQRGLLRVADLILPNDGSELVLVIDQFEEVFTLVEDEAERQQFLNLLTTAVTDTRSRVRVIITLRADFYDRPLNYPEFGDLVRSHMETVLPLSAKGLERAIGGPAQRVGVRFEEGLVSSIVAEMNYQAGALPLLQYALTELFERRDGRLLTQQAYQEIGGAVGALAKRAEDLFNDLSPEGQEAARQMFLRLVTLGEGVEDTRRRTPRGELLAIGVIPTPNPSPLRREGLQTPPLYEMEGGEDLMDEILDTYAAYRLLTLDNDLATRTPTVELAHEAMLREWERLRGWLNESRQEIRLQRQLAAMAADWRDANGDRTLLAHGSRLEQFEKWAKDAKLALTPEEREYLEASLAQRTKEEADEEKRQARELKLAQDTAKAEKNAARRLRQLVAVLVVAIIGALILSGITINERQAAQTERDNIQIAQATLSVNFQRVNNIRLAYTANSFLLTKDPYNVEAAALLSIRALRNGYVAEADAVLQTMIHSGFPVRYFRHPTFGTDAVAFSPDGRFVATGDDDGVLLLSEAQSGEQVRAFVGHTTDVFRLAFSPDGRFLASASADGTARLWRVETGEQVLQLDHAGVVLGASFSPDGTRIATAGQDHMVHIWDASSGALLLEFVADPAFVNNVIFSPNGRYVLTGGDNASVRLWDAATGTLVRQFPGHTFWVTALDFNADGTKILSGSDDKTARLWDTETGAMLQEFTCESGILSVDISPDDRYALTACGAFAKLWDLTTGELRHEYRVEGNSRQVRFSPDGQYFMTTSENNFAYMWETHPFEYPRIFATNNVSLDGAFSPDGHLLATGGGDELTSEIVLWDYEKGDELWRYTDLPLQATNVDFSPDGRYLAANSHTLTLLLDAATGAEIRRFASGNGGNVWGLDFSPDGRRLVTASFGRNNEGAFVPGVVVVWDVQTGEQIWQSVDLGDSFIGATFSPDGRTIITGNHDSIARLLDAADGHEIRRFQHPAAVYMVDFSHDGRYIATAGWDGVARIWDVNTGDEVRQFIGHQNRINGITFSSDDRYLLTGSSDSTVRLWDTTTGALLRTYFDEGEVIGVSFSRDDQYIVAGSFGGGTRVWQRDLQPMVEFICSRLTRDLYPSERIRYETTDFDPTCLSNPDLISRETSIQSIYALGDFQRAVGCLGTEVPDCQFTRLEDTDGDGSYTLTLTTIPAGHWYLLIGLNGRKVEMYGVNGVEGGDPLTFDVPADNAPVTITYDSRTHLTSVTMLEVIPTSVP